MSQQTVRCASSMRGSVVGGVHSTTNECDQPSFIQRFGPSTLTMLWCYHCRLHQERLLQTLCSVCLLPPFVCPLDCACFGLCTGCVGACFFCVWGVCVAVQNYFLVCILTPRFGFRSPDNQIQSRQQGQTGF